MRALLLILLLPSLAAAQLPTPEYLRLVRADSLAQTPALPGWRTLRLTPGNIVRRVSESDTAVCIERFNARELFLRGNYVLTAGLRQANRRPPLQSAWAQGRSANGALAWNGAETGEVFSYGPALAHLEYDGLPAYPYDRHGRLVPLGTGGGRPAAPYGNSLFRTAHSLSHQLTLEARVLQYPWRQIGVRVEAEQQEEDLTLVQNRNRRQKFMASASYDQRPWRIGADFLYSATRFSNPNRNGFLQNVYRQSLLAPATFDLHYGTGNAAFGQGMDNPFYLLANNGQFARTLHRQFKASATYFTDHVELRLEPSVRRAEDETHRRYKPGSADYPDGYMLRRSQRDQFRQLRTEASWYFNVNGDWLSRGNVHLDHVFNDDRTDISLDGTAPQSTYAYQRTDQRLSASANLVTDAGALRFTLAGGAAAYLSNTLSKPAPLLPWAQLTTHWNPGGVRFEASLSYRENVLELRPEESLATQALLDVESYRAGGFMPLLEVSTYDRQPAIRQSEWNGRMEMRIDNGPVLTVTLFQRETLGDVMALPANGKLELRPVGNHIREGLDIELEYEKPWYAKSSRQRWSTRHSLQFVTWQHLVTKAYAGSEDLPVSGFRDVYRIFAEGWPVDAIAGTYWQRDGLGRRVIGGDGFPLQGPGTRIIANAKPDYVVTMNNGVRWSFLRLETVLEWQKGGVVWNGTAAALDYYGRSAASGQLRNVDDYVFPGVSLTGHPNAQAVRFYDPALPVERNRWVRYGPGGVAEDYVEQNDYLNLRRVSLSGDLPLKRWLSKVSLTLFAENIFLWQSYSGAAPGQMLYDQTAFSGLDYFRLPSSRQVGASLHLQF